MVGDILCVTHTNWCQTQEKKSFLFNFLSYWTSCNTLPPGSHTCRKVSKGRLGERLRDPLAQTRSPKHCCHKRAMPWWPLGGWEEWQQHLLNVVVVIVVIIIVIGSHCCCFPLSSSLSLLLVPIVVFHCDCFPLSLSHPHQWWHSVGIIWMWMLLSLWGGQGGVGVVCLQLQGGGVGGMEWAEEVVQWGYSLFLALSWRWDRVLPSW